MIGAGGCDRKPKQVSMTASKVIIEQNMGGSLSAYNVDGGAEFRIDILLVPQ